MDLLSRQLLRLLLWYTGRLPAKLICDKGTRYLERYFVGRVFGCCIYIHHFVASDPVRGLHDHPWRWALSLVLRGFYFEQTRSGYRAVHWLNSLVGDTFHRVVLPCPVMPDVLMAEDLVHKDDRMSEAIDCWTLFIHSAKCKPWGFMRPAHIDPQAQRATMHYYIEHRDQDASNDSAAWAATAPKGRELR